MHDFKSIHSAVTIWATLVTHSNAQTTVICNKYKWIIRRNSETFLDIQNGMKSYVMIFLHIVPASQWWLCLNSTNETLLFDRFLIMCVFTCIFLIFVFRCTHVNVICIKLLLTYLQLMLLLLLLLLLGGSSRVQQCIDGRRSTLKDCNYSALHDGFQTRLLPPRLFSVLAVSD